jgi:hypothetical protein
VVQNVKRECEVTFCFDECTSRATSLLIKFNNLAEIHQENVQLTAHDLSQHVPFWVIPGPTNVGQRSPIERFDLWMDCSMNGWKVLILGKLRSRAQGVVCLTRESASSLTCPELREPAWMP